MQLSILPGGDVPAYRQITEQLTAQILSGALRAGEALPPIRAVAKELGVSVITVRSAWDALSEAGLIETRGGSGCYVADLSPEQREQLRSSTLSEALRQLVQRAKALGMGPEELAARLRERWDEP